MWEKKDAKAKVPDVKPADSRAAAPATPNSTAVPPPAPSTVGYTTPPMPAASKPGKDIGPLPAVGKEETVKIGRSIILKGEVSGAQDLIIEGTVEGKVDLRSNQVTIGQNGRINGEIMARHLVIYGKITGNCFAEERLEIRASGSLRGDIIAPRLIIEDGAFFKGSIEMESRKEGLAKDVERHATVTYETVGEGKR
ncbi:MAG: polymer-forming cytoskeletal protein [Acidobacteria bacterium]|nr:polymer-forming cytoskeletal protein [Acidobacteriota bacterium]MBI3655063.1 polymer-forming cytoskeletal protein [Acidobacteriota bacterium]